MKDLKKFAGVLLALVMVIVMAVPAFAEEPQKGTITIKGPIVGETYTIYKMFDLESFSTDKSAYSYKITEEWKGFVQEGGAGAAYFKMDANGYVTVNGAITNEAAAELAKAALKYAKDKPITPAEGHQKKAESADDLVFENLDLGYYLVDSSLGTLCGLKTTAPDMEINEKNGTPTVVKKIVVSDGSLVDKNTAKIGDVINFKTTITVANGAGNYNYILHDEMNAGFKLTPEFTVQVGGVDVNNTNYDIKIANTETAGSDTCAFEIIFHKDYIADLTQDMETAEIVVTYPAILTKDAVAGEGTKNETWLQYGDVATTTHSITYTYTYQFELVKTKRDKTVLDGAEFELYDHHTSGNKIVLADDGNGLYHVATAEEQSAEGFQPAVIKAGKATVKGLGNGTYYLEETKQPDGYNKLSQRQAVNIKDANLSALYAEDGKYVSGGVQVVNFAGSVMPSTGGVGTTIFYIVGGILLVGAGVLLVVRKRMNAEKKEK